MNFPDNVNAEALTEDAVFMTLAVKVPGRDDVLARMVAEDTGTIYRAMNWASRQRMAIPS